MAERILYAIEEYGYLADPLAKLTGLRRGELVCRTFPDGERYMRIADDVRNRTVVVLGGTLSDAATLALFDLACGAVTCGAQRLVLVLPYYGYSTMERAILPGEVVTAKTRARLLSAIPIAARGNHGILVDIHSEGIPHYFEGALTARNVQATEAVQTLIRSQGGDDFVLGATDAGRAKWIQSLANTLGVEPGLIIKRRISPTQTEVQAVSANVAGRTVVIYDDMIRTGGSLAAAARAYRNAGAQDVKAVTTHGVFVDNAVSRLLQDDILTGIATTDTHPRALVTDRVQVASIAPVLARALQDSEGWS